MKSTRPNSLLLAATQHEVRTLPPRRLVERKQAREDSGHSCELRRWFRALRLITVNYGADAWTNARPMKCRAMK